jgi:hypothetical protein
MAVQNKQRLREELRQELLEELRAELNSEKLQSAPSAGAVPSQPAKILEGWQAYGAGALGAAALMLASENREKLRPLVVGTLKEFYRFKDWLGTNVSSAVEDLGDMSAEARKSYHDELAEHLASLERERELVQRLQDLSKRHSGES